MAKDKNGKVVKAGDTVNVQFYVKEASDVEGPGTNLVLRAINVPEGEAIPIIHANAAMVELASAPALTNPAA